MKIIDLKHSAEICGAGQSSFVVRLPVRNIRHLPVEVLPKPGPVILSNNK